MYKINDSILEQNLKNQRSDRNFFLTVIVLAVILFVISFLNTVVFFNVRVSGISMNPTLYGGVNGKNGDVLTVNKLKTPTRGDIVIIEGVEEYWLIKRVIAIEGDTVKIENGRVHLKKKGESAFTELKESYAKGTTVWTGKEGVPLSLGKNEVFYLGDNREHSSDSRDSGKGVCKLKNVIGVVENWSISIKEFRRKLYDLPQKFVNLFR